ncbi:MAG: DUF4397 domain-containing protein [Ginsengibacter sp.]
MKKVFSFLRLNIIPIAGVLFISFLFTACKKTLNSGTHTPVAGLMAFNLVPDKAAVGVAISGNVFTTSPLNYTNYTGGYLNVYTGSRNVESYDYTSQQILDSTTQLFEDSAYYSVFVVGANGHYKNIIVKDNVDSLSSSTGEAYVRYVNAIPDSTSQPKVTISANGTNVFSDDAAFATVSGFKGVMPGDVAITVNNEAAINASRTVTLEQGKIYTVLLTGLPGATDSTKAVAIKFIQNGSVTP